MIEKHPLLTSSLSRSVGCKVAETTKPKTRWLLGVLLLLFLVGCERGGKDLPDVGLQWAIAPEPPQIGPAGITVTLSDASGQPIKGAEVELEGNMNHAGMVPVLTQATEMSPGLYQANLEFTMGGDWFILVRAKLPDGRSMERRIDLPGVDTVCSETPTP